MPRLVSQLTGAHYSGRIEAVAARPASPYSGIAVVLDDSIENCGRAWIGAMEGLIRLAPGCTVISARILNDLFAHEFGHAMGFWHTDPDSTNPPGKDCMATGYLGGDACDGGGSFTPREQYHAQLAYKIGPGAPYCGWPLSAACYEPSSFRFSMNVPPIVVVD